MSRKKPTLKEVAVMAGVSPITVSRFVNTPDLVSETAREKIIQAIEKSGYIPNAAARQLKTSQSDVVFFVVPNIRNDLYASLSHELMLKLSATNKSLFICDYNFQDHLEQMLIQAIYRHRPAAVVMAAGDGMESAQRQLLNSSKIPVIQFDRVNDDISCQAKIELDNGRGGELAAEYLRSMAIKRAVIFAGKTKRVMQARIDGFSQVCDAAGIGVDIIEMTMQTPDSDVFSQLDMSGDTGYFLLNSDIANRFFRANSHRISHHIAQRVVTFDRVTNGEFLPFPLISIRYADTQFIDSILLELEKVFANDVVTMSEYTIPVYLAQHDDPYPMKNR